MLVVNFEQALFFLFSRLCGYLLRLSQRWMTICALKFQSRGMLTRTTCGHSSVASRNLFILKAFQHMTSKYIRRLISVWYSMAGPVDYSRLLNVDRVGWELVS